MLNIAFGMKDAVADATQSPMVAMMAGMLEANRTNLDEDEFLTALADFALLVASGAVSRTAELCLDDTQKDELEKTIKELMSMDSDLE